MTLQFIPTNDNALRDETPGTIVIEARITESACQSAWAQTMSALPLILLIAAIAALWVNLILVVEKRAVAEHLNSSQPAATDIGRGL